MKLVLNPLLVLVATVTLSSLAQAKTALVLSSSDITISGSLKASTKIDALSYYVPAYKMVDGKKPAACLFAEDELAVNDTDKFVNQKAVRSANGYSLSIPTTGMRGKCPYVLDTTYISIQDGQKVQETYKLQTSLSITEENNLIGAEPLEDQAPDFSALGSVYCDYESPDSIVVCSDKDNFLPEPVYAVSSKPKAYTFDVKDISLMPAPQY